jgi:hypothetical protein
MDELYGDKIVSAVCFSIFHKYGIPRSWGAALGGILLSNKYFRKISESQNLAEHLFLSRGPKIYGDAFEVLELA